MQGRPHQVRPSLGAGPGSCAPALGGFLLALKQSEWSRSDTECTYATGLQQVEAGNFARASEDILKKRKIIKARRGAGCDSTPAAANPFAGLSLPGAATPAAAAVPAAPAAANPFASISLFPAKTAVQAGGERPAAGEAEVKGGEKAEEPASEPSEAAATEAAAAGAQQGADETREEAQKKPEKAEAGEAAAAELGEGGEEKEAQQGKEAEGAAAPSGGFGLLAGGAKAGGLLFGGAGATGGFGSLGKRYSLLTEAPPTHNFLPCWGPAWRVFREGSALATVISDYIWVGAARQLLRAHIAADP